MRTTVRAGAAAALLGGALVSCDARPSEPEISWTGDEGGRWRALSFEGVEGARFSALAPGATGLRGSTDISEAERLANRTWTHGTGVALGDVDGDGRVDVYLCLFDRPNALYRNLGGWRFEDITSTSGAGLDGVLSRGAVLADADGDGDPDLFVTVHGAPNLLLANDGAGRFERVASGFEGAYGSSTLALADLDADGDLDAYVANYKTIQGDDLFSPEERNLRGAIRQVGDRVEVSPPYGEHYRVERIGDRMRRFELADPDELYRNDGSGRFEPVPFTEGAFLGADGAPLQDPPRVWGLVARFFDADDDGDPDLYVANDFGSPDGFWLNDGGTLRAASALVLRTTSASSMGVDFTDLEGDGDTDFITTEMLALDPVRRREQVSSSLAPRTPPGLAAMRAPAARNAVQRNRGDGTFAEVGRAAGVEASEWTWGAMFLDADLDGHEDLLVTNGHVWDPLDGDTQEDLRTGRVRVDWREELGVFPPLDLANLAFRNRGDGTFEVAPEAWRYGTDRDVSHGMASADLDRDGDRDLVITRFNEPPLVLRNDAGGARIAVRLRGGDANTQAVGARIELVGGATPLQTRQVTAGGMYLSGSDPGVTFAMGGRDSATLRVRWPSGARTTRRVAANTALELFEPEPAAGPSGSGDAGVARGVTGPGPVAGSTAGPLFAPWPAAARHAESDFDELARQPLIPLELSRLGPGVTWADLDEDGAPELLVAGAAGGRAQRLEGGANGVLAPRPFGPLAPGDQTTLLALRTRDGMEVVAGVSSWEARSPDELTRIPPAVGLAGGGEILAQATPDATGPLSAADVDGDGAVDLFLGARAIPGAYPRAASSRILLRRDGVWREDPGWSAAFRSIGLVSASAFSDVDLDGDPDLLLALEWGPVRLFLNRGTRFEDATAAWGLAGLPGRWNGIATGDLDGDGRPDLVVTGWGNNVSHPPSADRPTGILAADMDGNGLVDVVEFETRPSGEAWPTRGYPALSAALPFIRRAAPSYERFARSSLEDLFGADPPGASRVSAVTYAHTAFMNREGRFEARPLPETAQRAPAFGVVIGDFDRDGAEDVFLAQNFLATPQGLPRFDAGRGLLLAGDGEGGLVPLEARESGITVYGDGRGAAAADADGDGRWDLAVGQNGGEVAVFRGRSGPPGLWVRLRHVGANPDAIGARLRVRYEESAGPAREIQAGAGYGSSGGLAQVFGLRGQPVGVRVWWPGGAAEDFRIDADERKLVLVRGEGGRP